MNEPRKEQLSATPERQSAGRLLARLVRAVAKALALSKPWSAGGCLWT